jgi:hypothetical protein
MKVIKYELCVKANQGTDTEPIFVEKLFPIVIGWNEANEAIAQKEAYNGVYTIEDDGKPESDNSTTDDVLNALLGVE